SMKQKICFSTHIHTHTPFLSVCDCFRLIQATSSVSLLPFSDRDRQTDRQTDRKTDTHTHTQTYPISHIHIRGSLSLSVNRHKYFLFLELGSLCIHMTDGTNSKDKRN